MPKKQPIIMDEKMAGKHVSAMLVSTGWQVVVQYLNIKREEIIGDGKKARSEEKQIRNWARLAGFDDAVATIVDLGKANQIDEIIQEEPEDD